MGIWDNIINLSKGSARKTLDFALAPGERELQRAFAATNFGRIAKTNGQLILTNQRLVFSPWSTKDVAAVLSAVLPLSGLPALTGSIPGAAVDLMGSPVGIPLVEITAVTTSAGANWFRPPSIFVTRKTDQVEFNVLAAYLSPSRAADIRARDTFAKGVSDAVAAARS